MKIDKKILKRKKIVERERKRKGEEQRARREITFFEPFGMYCPLTIDQIHRTREKEKIRGVKERKRERYTNWGG